MLEGELTVIVDGKETVLKKHDSCFIGPNENREIINRGNEVCTILVAIAPRRAEIVARHPRCPARSAGLEGCPCRGARAVARARRRRNDS